MKTIRWAIVGCGDVTEVKSGPALYKTPGSTVQIVMRRDAAKAEDYARRHAVPRWTTDAAAAIADGDVDAVYVATPPGTHASYALQAAAAGKPAYIEKPMARNHRECLSMCRAFAQRGLPLFVAYYRRALPRFLKARELLQAGAIGTLTSVLYRYHSPINPEHTGDRLPWRLHVPDSGGGHFLDLGSHLLDVLDFIVGPLVFLGGGAANLGGLYDAEDTVTFCGTTPAGALVSANWNFAANRREDLLELVGTSGRVALSCFGNEPVQLESPGGTSSFDLPNPRHVHGPLVETIVGELLGSGVCPSTGATAARTSLLMDRILGRYYPNRDALGD